MFAKKEIAEKCVYKFTETAIMRFRPHHVHQQVVTEGKNKQGLLSSVSNILGGFFKMGQNNTRKADNFEANWSYQKSSILEGSQSQKNKSQFLLKNEKSEIKSGSPSQNSQQKQLSRVYSASNTSLVRSQRSQLTFLEKISPETFLIGNKDQLDLISIIGIYQNNIDTDLNWSFSIDKMIKKVAVDIKKMLIAIEGGQEIYLYKYDLRKIKNPPVFLNKVRTQGEFQFLLFLKDNLIGVFYSDHLQIFQIQDNNVIKQIFNKKYGVQPSLILFQVPKPVQNALNIFFKQPSKTIRVHTLWRLQIGLKNISSSHTFKSLMRIYDIPNSLMKRFRIDNYSHDTFIMNFQHEIYAAKEGYIVDNVNVNIQEEESCLIYRGDHLLSISDTKLDLYGFKIITNVKPSKIVLNTIDSIIINKNRDYFFFDCLQMLNGNFVLFFQIKPQKNKKTKGQIDYLITVTQKLTVSQKLSQIFTFKSARQLRKIAKKNYALIQQKCDIAFKIGLSRKQVYLELWMKSAKSTVSDYNFLLDTLDYQTIKQQIEKKLKKSSMLFRQVYKLQQSCFGMLKKQLLSPDNCSQQSVKDYIKSHFLLRKLQFFRDTQAIKRSDIFDQFQEEIKNKEKGPHKGDKKKNNQNDQSQDSQDKQENDQLKKFRLHINIQQYFNCVNLELKSYFLDLASQLSDSKSGVVEQLRFFVRKFKFPLRIVYSTLLQSLIIQSKSKLINFMKAFPEILPYEYIGLPEDEDPSLFKGLSQPISIQQWAKNLHFQQINTIYNKETVNQLIKTIWFKRNQYTLHDLIPLSKQKIVQIAEFNSSDAIFYFFIEKIFEHCKQEQDQKKVISYLQQNYLRLPQHLKGRMFLYKKLFSYFGTQNYSSPNITTFNTFLKMQDYELFRQLFRHEKTKKGCLLKDAMNIYAELPDGNQIYKQSLLRYFSSNLSQISDLKCILNRLNNEKIEFHTKNEGIYEVLVKAMEIKVKLGTDNDIPLQQVMIYIDNIPLNKESTVIDELKVVQQINQFADLFKSMKINLSFLEIMEKEEYVIGELLNFFINQRELMSTVKHEQFMTKTYDILAKVQIVKQRIYKDRFRDLQYFLYLNKLLEHKQMIKFARLVLADPYLQAEYDADQIILQNLVLYMVKWKLEERAYQQDKDYLDELLTILPEDNSIRNYILAEAEFAIMLSTPECPVLYPLAPTNSQATNEVITIRLGQIQNLFQRLDAKFISRLDLQHLYDLVKQMEHFYEEQIIQIEDIYEIALKRLLELGQVKQAIPLFKKAYSLLLTKQNYSSVFCLLIVDKIITDIPQSHRKDLIKIVFYTFSQPLQLIQIIESRLNSKLSNDEEGNFMTIQLEKVKKNKCYSSQSLLIDQLFLSKVKEREDKHNSQFQELIFQTWNRVCNNRQDFNRSLDYTWIFIILLNNPYALSKFISAKGESLNIRLLRSFLSYVYRQEIFNGVNILRFARRAFIISLEQIYTQFTVEYLASQYKGVGLQQEEQILIENEVQSPLENKLIKSIKAFTKKLHSIKAKPVQPEDEQKKKKRVLALLTSQLSIKLEQSQYPFSDSDDENHQNEKQEISMQKLSSSKVQKKGVQKKLLREKEKNLALYLSNMGGSLGQQQIRKTSPRLLKSSLAFRPQFQSLHFPKAKHSRKQNDHTNDNKYAVGKIARFESIGVEGDEEMNDEVLPSMYTSQKYNKAAIKDDRMFASVEQNSLRPMINSNNLKAMTNSESSHISNEQIYIQLQSPVRLKPSESLLNDDIWDDKAKEISANQMKIQEHELGNQQFQYNFTVNVKEINDQTYTQPAKLVKQLVEDHSENQIDPMFNISLIIAQKEKEFDNFDGYLKQIVKSAYEMRSKPLSLMLKLIKQIQVNFNEINIQSEFLKVYIALQSYNTKYNYNLPIRQMFPIQGIFLQTSQLKALFHFVKQKILQFVDFGHIFVVAKVIHFSFQKSDIKDQLYYSYLAQAVQQYGNDSQSSQEELLMQKERIGGIVEQIILLNILVERGRQLLGSIRIASRRQQIGTVIKQVFRKKKKENLIALFQKIAYDI